ncbi:hypothetical protein HNQ60_000181 [Povalibacter uvarum]|uniref:TIR domain-containing protein n=1 Tax=Povalibacter uvarum TaxID=732238 RepID=A0A841HGX3_9GAMM|nr:toll/interleukin-1 receptor domain-containing protein [Povalibacter uvarum]MBB6091335.1 hypothetical protein [Povalibacter uvarum]
MTSHCFICYSRKDGDTAEAIAVALRGLSHSVEIDVDGIRGGEDWRRKLKSIINNADNIVFLVSPDSLISTYCRWELDYSNTLSKRLIPVLLRTAPGVEIPESVGAFQWLDGKGVAPGELARQISVALQEDQTWAEFHTQLLLRAIAWKDDKSAILRGRELTHAEKMALQYQGRRPELTEAQSALLIASRSAARRRFLIGLSATAAISVIIGIGVTTWLARQQESARRLVEQTGTYLRGGDVPGAVATVTPLASREALQRLARSRATTSWPQTADNLLRFWSDRLMPLPEVSRAAASPSLVFLNDRPAIKLQSGALQPLTPKGYYSVHFAPTLNATVVADAAGVSLHKVGSHDPLVSLTIDERSHVLGTYDVAKPALAAVVAERRVVNNDEDEPQSVFTYVYVAFPVESSRTPVCVDKRYGADPARCAEGRMAVANGFALAELQLEENHRLVSLATDDRDLYVHSKLDCSFEDECGGGYSDTVMVSVDSEGLTISQSSAESSGRNVERTIAPQERLMELRFPDLRREKDLWSLAPVPPEPPWQAPVIADRDFSRIAAADGDSYSDWLIMVEDKIELSEGGIVWSFAPGGNSWSRLIHCRFDRARVIEECKDMSLGAISSETEESGDNRFVAQRNCESRYPSLQLLNMTAFTEEKIPVPPGLVLALAFNRASTLLTALTDQHELWTYQLAQPQGARLANVVALPGAALATDEDACERGQTLVFVDDRHVIGTEAANMFAVDVEGQSIGWVSTLPEMKTKIDNVQPNLWTAPAGSYFAVTQGMMIQLFDSGTGLALTEAFEPASLLGEALDARRDWISSAQIAADGSVAVRCSPYGNACASNMFVRRPPKEHSPDCTSVEMLTGRSIAQRRVSEGELLLQLGAATKPGCTEPAMLQSK